MKNVGILKYPLMVTEFPRNINKKKKSLFYKPMDAHCGKNAIGEMDFSWNISNILNQLDKNDFLS